MRTYYEEVKIKAVRKWKDEDGKQRQKTKIFLQTINPYNQDKDGNIKSREQILMELNEQRRIWLLTGHK